MLLALAVAFILGVVAAVAGLLLFVLVFATSKAVRNEAAASHVNYPAFSRILRERHQPLTAGSRDFEQFVSGTRSRLMPRDQYDPDKFIKEKEKERKAKFHLEKEEEKKEKKVKKLEKKQRKEEIEYTKKLEKEDRKTEEKEKEKEEREQREKEKAEKYQEKLKKKEEKEKEKEKRKEEEEREKLQKRQEKERRDRERSSPSTPQSMKRNGSSGSMIDRELHEKSVGVMMRESGHLIREGWVHVRSLSSWSKRWLQVCNERIFLYKNEKVHDLQGIIVLSGCNLIPRRKKSFSPEDMLEISHPERRSIFARAGPQNERLSPWSSYALHHILLRFKSVEEMRDWVGAMKRFAESQPDRNIRLLENAQSFEAVAAAAVTNKNDANGNEEEPLYVKGGDSDEEVVSESEDSEVLQEIKDAMRTNRSHPESPSDANGSFSGGVNRSMLQVRTHSEGASGIIGRRAIAASDGATSPHSSASSMLKRKKKGWLEMRSYRGNFRRLWVVLRNDMLVLAKTESMGDTYGFIRLEGCEVRRLTDGFGEKRSFVFEVYAPSKRSIFTYKEDKKKLPASIAPNCIIAAASEDDMQEWLTELQTICPLRDPASVPFVVTTPFAHPHKTTQADENASSGSGSARVHEAHPDSKGTPPAPLPPLDSFNVLLQRYFRDMQDSRTFHNDMLRRLVRKFTNMERPGWLGQITIQELDVGVSFPEFKNLRIMPSAVPNELIGEADMLYEGALGITIATEIYLNWPRNKFAIVPLLASIRVTHLSGKLYFYGPPELQGRFYLSFGELPLSKFDVDIRIGENEMKVLKLPRLREWLISTFHKTLYERSVHPNRITFSLPFPGRKFNFKAECLTKKSAQNRDNRAIVDPARESAEVYARKFLVTRLFDEVLNHGQLHVVDELFDRNVIVTGVAPAWMGQPMSGLDAVKRFVVDLRCGFPNMVFAIEDIAYENSNVHCRWRGKATHTGMFWEAPATGRDIELSGVLVSKFASEQIIDQAHYWDLTASFFTLFARRRDM